MWNEYLMNKLHVSCEFVGSLIEGYKQSSLDTQRREWFKGIITGLRIQLKKHSEALKRRGKVSIHRGVKLREVEEWKKKNEILWRNLNHRGNAEKTTKTIKERMKEETIRWSISTVAYSRSKIQETRNENHQSHRSMVIESIRVQEGTSEKVGL